MTSSSVTTPAVPPYSSTTTAICMPCARSSTSSGPSRTVSGTRGAGPISAAAGTSVRFSNGTAIALRRCTRPTTSSREPSITGKRECPVDRAAATTSAAVSSRVTTSIRVRSVITSTAVSVFSSMEFVSSTAVPTSSVPTWAERRTRATSSVAERPPDSSSRGCTPNRRRIALAVPLSTTITGRNAAVNASWDGATARAVAIGTESARFFGTSSPTSMENPADEDEREHGRQTGGHAAPRARCARAARPAGLPGRAGWCSRAGSWWR